MTDTLPAMLSISVNVVLVAENRSTLPATRAWIELNSTSPVFRAVPPRLLRLIPPEVVLSAMIFGLMMSIAACFPAVPVTPIPSTAIRSTVAPVISTSKSSPASIISPLELMVTISSVVSANTPLPAEESIEISAFVPPTLSILTAPLPVPNVLIVNDWLPI